MVANLKKTEKDFKFGRMFLKKYQIIFNSDTKSMSFYKNNFKRKNIYEGNNNNKRIFKTFISYFFIGILFLGLGIFFGRKFCINKKRLANELEDDNYEYKSKKDEFKKEKKLIEMV